MARIICVEPSATSRAGCAGRRHAPAADFSGRAWRNRATLAGTAGPTADYKSALPSTDRPLISHRWASKLKYLQKVFLGHFALGSSMPISVVCSGCQTRFEVSEKYAGKQGLCPKCKSIIKIPEVLADDVKIHAPKEFATGGKDRKGRAITKPVPRSDAKVRPGVIGAIIVGSVLSLAVALVGRSLGEGAKLVLGACGLFLVGPPLAVGGYFFLRNDELEAYQGRELWTRAALCGMGYAILWGVFAGLRLQWGIPSDMYHWVFVAPLLIAAGGALAVAAFDLDFGSGALHYCFYLIVTLLLRAAIGLSPLWTATSI